MSDSATAERDVRLRQIAAGPARAAVLRCHYDASIAAVWAACVEPDRLNRWFAQANGDLRAGGSFQIEGNAHGEIVRCEPPRLLRLTWAYAERLVDEVELRLAPDSAGGTLLEFEHATATTAVEWEGAQVDPLPDVGANWELALTQGLARYLQGELPDAPAAEWFEFTPDMMALYQRYADEWTALAASAANAAG
jgi:uncharacterized protein YndB with AHSA1/START domain